MILIIEQAIPIACSIILNQSLYKITPRATIIHSHFKICILATLCTSLRAMLDLRSESHEYSCIQPYGDPAARDRDTDGP